MTAPDNIVPVLLEKVYGLIAEKVNPAQRALVMTLAQQLLGQLADDDLLHRNESDLYGAVLSLWQHLVANQPSQISVSVYNPSVSLHGWKSTHTVVEIVTPDQPFLVDSIRMVLDRLGITSHLMLNGPYRFQRDDNGQIVKACSDDGDQQTLFHIEVDRLPTKAEIAQLKRELTTLLKDITLVVRDWQPMQQKLLQIAAELQDHDLPISAVHCQEALEFINWLTRHNFTFMGYHTYDLTVVDGDYELT